MLKIYKCIKNYNDIRVESYWAAQPNHYIFQKIEIPSGLKHVFKYIPSRDLKRYFVELKENKK